MNFVFHRDRTVASTSGHVIGFKKGEPQYVPPEARKDVLEAGGVPDEDFDPAPAKKGDPDAPVDPTERKKAVFAAFETMVKRNTRGDFTGNGQPSSKVLKAELGWELDVRERDVFWQEFQASGATK